MMKHNLIVISILIFALVLANISFNKNTVSSMSINDIIPKQIENWQSSEISVSKSVFSVIDEEDLLMRAYKKNGVEVPVSAGIVYTKIRNHIHNPIDCFSGQGYDIYKVIPHKVSDKFTVQLLKSRKNRQEYRSIVWYTEGNEVFSDKSIFMKKIIKNKFFDVPMNGFAVVTLTSIYNGEDDFKNLEELAVEINKFLINKTGKTI